MTEEGICCLDDNVYSKSVLFKDINYTLAEDDGQKNIFEEYKTLLNSMGNDVDVSLVINNRVVDREEFEKQVLMTHHADGLDPIRIELNQHLLNNLNSGHNFIVHDKMFVFSCHEENYLEAKKSLDSMEKGFKEQLNSMKCQIEKMDGLDRMKVLRSITKPNSPLRYTYNDLGIEQSTKDWIVPNAFNFHKDYFEMDDRFCTVLFLLNFPTRMTDKLIYELSKVKTNLTISFHMSIMSKDESMELINKKSQLVDIQVDDELEKRRKRGDFSETLPPNLRSHVESIQQWRTAVEECDERIFSTKLMIMINASSYDELNQVKKDIIRIGKRNGCDFGTMEYEQEIGFNAVLPLGLPWTGSNRLLLTDNIACMTPFDSQELIGDHGSVYYGINQTTNNMILFDRTNMDKNSNPNGFILGTSGAGKSFTTKKELSWIFLNNDNDDIIIIDPQGEYKRVVDTFNKYSNTPQGTVLEMSSTSKLYFNPFDGDITQPDFVREKAVFIQVLMAEMVGRGSLNPQAQAITDRIVYKVFENYEIALRDKDYEHAVMPTLKTFYEELGKLDDPVAQSMHAALWSYVYGSSDIFAHQSNINVDNRLMVYDISNLTENLRTLGTKIVLESIRTRIINNHKKGKRTWVYIDEIWRLLQDKYSEEYLSGFWKWVRKFSGACTGLTQNVSDLLNSDNASKMLQNSNFYILLGQNNLDAMQLQALLGLSEKQVRYLLQGRSGAGLIRAGETIVPFADKFSKDTICYQMWHTDPNTSTNEENELLELKQQAERYQRTHTMKQPVFSTPQSDVQDRQGGSAAAFEENRKTIDRGNIATPQPVVTEQMQQKIADNSIISSNIISEAHKEPQTESFVQNEQKPDLERNVFADALRSVPQQPTQNGNVRQSQSGFNPEDY